MLKLKNFGWYEIIRILAASFLAFLIATIIIFVVAREDANIALKNFFLGAFSSRRNFSKVVEDFIPMVFSGLAINIMFKSGLFSLAADSAFYMSGVVATAIAIGIPLPAGIHQIVILLTGALVGGMLCLIPAIVRKYTGAHELVTSMMLSYITFNLGYWIIREFFIDKNNGVFSTTFAATATLGKMFKGTNIHYGLLIMAAAVIVMWIVIEKSRYGRELSFTGSNENFARYAGIEISTVILISQFVGGFWAGLGGAVTMIGIFRTFQWMTPVDYVWDGILINLLAGRKPQMIPLAAFFMSYLRVGANIMSRVGHVDSELVAIIQAIIILLIASERFLYRMKQRKEEREALLNKTSNFIQIEDIPGSSPS
jgi:simple sugar transport system permease protein